MISCISTICFLKNADFIKMTILICSGPLFADWKKCHLSHVLMDSLNHPKSAELSALNRKICEHQWPEKEELAWAPFSPDQTYLSEAKQLLDSDKDSSFVWIDNDSCLLLDFWNNASGNTKFALFYSSPEFELANYIKDYSYDATETQGFIENWIRRNRAMLSFFMRNRETCLLFDLETANKAPINLVKIINNAFNTELLDVNRKNKQRIEDVDLYEYLAATILNKNDMVSELFDEIRSAATVIGSEAPILLDIEARTEKLIPAFLEKINQYENTAIGSMQLPEVLANAQLQLYQAQKELEHFYLKERDTAIFFEQFVENIYQKQFLNIARVARLSENTK